MYVQHYYWLFPNASLLAGVYLVYNFGGKWSPWFSYSIYFGFGFVACCHAIFLLRAEKSDLEYTSHAPEAPKRPAQRIMPPVRINGVVNQMTVDLVKFDKERGFARTLIQMRSDWGLDKVDTTEGFWVKSGKFPRSEFVELKNKWRHYGALFRKSEHANSPDTVGDWKLVRKIANGNPLPPIPH